MESPEKSRTPVVRAGVERVCKELTLRLTPMGFSRSKKMFWTRRHPFTIDFIYLFRRGSSYGVPINYSVDFRIHFGIRVLNDSFEGPALNGPSSDDPLSRSGKYHLRFNAFSGDTFDRCVDDLRRIVEEQGEPWFKKYGSESSLLSWWESPLRPDEKEMLRAAMDGESSPENIAASLKMLGLAKTPKK